MYVIMGENIDSKTPITCVDDMPMWKRNDTGQLKFWKKCATISLSLSKRRKTG